MRAVLFVPVVMMFAVAPAPAFDEKKAGRQNPAPSIEFTPAVVMAGDDVIMLVRVTPDSQNRWLSVEIESPSYYSSTERQLRGEKSPGMHRFTWRTLPASRYTVTVELRDSEGRLQSADRILTVHGPGQGDCVTESGVVGASCAGAPPIDGRR